MLDKENFEFIKNIDDLVKKATMIANIFFKDKKDKGGYPYLGHLQYVSNGFDDTNHKVVGLLHDVIEDTVVSKTILKELGFPDNIIDAIDILTRKTEDYSSYIDSIVNSNNLLAIDVKMKDLEHNMDITRISNPTEEDRKRIEKYKKSFEKLEKKRNELC